MPKRDENAGQREYSVGYCKPPPSGRFQKGDGGNRKGRNKGQKMAVSISEALSKTHDVMERGHKRRMTARDIIILKQISKAMNGDLRAAKFLLELRERGEVPVIETARGEYDLTVLSDEELDTLEQILSKASRDRTGAQLEWDK